MLAKMIYLARRNPALAREDWPRRWLLHSKVGSLPELLGELTSSRYCLVQDCRDVLAKSSQEYDGAAVLSARSFASLPLIADLLETKEVTLADELRVFDTFVKHFALFCAEEAVRDGEHGETAVLQFVRRQPGLGPTEFGRRWREGWERALAAGGLPELTRCALNTPVALAPPGYRFDGIAELWFPSEAAFEQAAPALTDAIAGFADLLDVRAGVTLVTRTILDWRNEAG